MINNETDFNKHKDSILKELARLERLSWAKDTKVAESIFPYAIVEAINLLLNSRLDGIWHDYTSTGEKTEETLSKILGEY